MNPEDEYTSTDKETARLSIWKALVERCPVPREQAQVLILCGPRALEIPLLLSLGFQEKNLHVVDLIGKYLQEAKTKYPEIHIYQGKLSHIAGQLPELQVVNLDLQGFLSGDWFIEVSAISRRLEEGSAIGVTFLRARDQAVTRFLSLRQIFHEKGKTVAKRESSTNWLQFIGKSRVFWTPKEEALKNLCQSKAEELYYRSVQINREYVASSLADIVGYVSGSYKQMGWLVGIIGDLESRRKRILDSLISFDPDDAWCLAYNSWEGPRKLTHADIGAMFKQVMKRLNHASR